MSAHGITDAADLVAAISEVRAAHPDLWWGGWWLNDLTHPAGIEQCRAAMTSPWGVGQVQRALAFIEDTGRTKGVTRRVSTYGWKHQAERLHRAGVGYDGSNCYVGEGSFVAAAFISGLLVKRGWWGTFVNLSIRAARPAADGRP